MKKWIACCLFLIAFHTVSAQQPSREYYSLTVYHFADARQEALLDQYLGKALLPALHRNGIRYVGVFKPLTNDTATDKRIYCLVPLKSLAQDEILQAKLASDKTYQTSGKDYITAAWNQSPYLRMERSYHKAFRLAPVMQLPQLKSPKAEHVYEFRSYESPTEAYYINKVKMFNEGGEVPLFKRLGFNAVFYAETLSGSRMPNLVYLTSFENREEREKHWKTFSDDPEWKKLVAMPEYQHNVSKADIILMRAADYSDY